MEKISVVNTGRKKDDRVSRKVKKCIRKFLYYFPGGFQAKKYIAWERDYKWLAHLEWQKNLDQKTYKSLLAEGKYLEIARTAVKIESRTNLLFSFEKMALRDAVKTSSSAMLFAESLYEYVYGKGTLKGRFELFRDTLSQLPVKQTRVLTWPLQTVFGFIADPVHHIFLKPTVTKIAAEKYGYEFDYKSRPNWTTYQKLLDFAEQIRTDTAHLKPTDMIDLQSFIWVQGSAEYPD
jgi:hypothetical protein